MSRLESQHSIPEKEPFPLDEQIKRCTILLSSAWEKKRIAFSADLEPVSYVGNEELMRHVWLNLLNNAIKFTPEGGEVSVTLQCSPEQIQVRISDTGIGMSPEMMTHIFDQYYQGEPNHTEKGLGLGLSIVHRIVELCGGQILVDSIPDQGSVFTVLLPRSPVIPDHTPRSCTRSTQGRISPANVSRLSRSQGWSPARSTVSRSTKLWR